MVCLNLFYFSLLTKSKLYALQNSCTMCNVHVPEKERLAGSDKDTINQSKLFT